MENAPSNVSNPNPNPKNQKTERSVKSPLIIGLTIVNVLAAAAIITCLIIMLNSKNNEPVANNQEQTQTSDTSAEKIPEEATEQKIADQAVATDLIKKVQLLFGNYQGDDYTLTGDKSMVSNPAFYPTKGAIDNSLTEADKIAVAINYHNVLASKKGNVARTYTAAEINDAYKKLFGTDIPNPQSGKTNTCFGNFAYNAAQQTYSTPVTGCGGTMTPYDYLYAYETTAKDDTAYVYVAAGSIVPETSGTGFVYTQFNDLSDHSSRSKISSSSDYDPSNNPINSSNYDQFTKYRFVFKKAADGSYYFEKVEKI
ncbi:hypothetical protein IJJ18_00170 [Candidatus Saccharibacteria bacterium]|nr:hypothetical protein [Candidatus Saccharibacteria bacterium]